MVLSDTRVPLGGKWFGGYARGKRPDGSSRNYLDEGSRSVARTTKALRGKAQFTQRGYADADVRPGDVVYCDPPYANTTSYKDTDAFDHDKFWDVCRDWAALGALVFVSEYTAPDDVVCVWQRAQTDGLRKGKEGKTQSIEKLFLLDNRSL